MINAFVNAESEGDFLNPSGSPFCVSKCAHYFAGSSETDLAVCQYQASGIGTISDNSNSIGVSCYPAYNCRSDWTVCLQPEAMEEASLTDAAGDFTAAYPPSAEDICGEIAGIHGYGIPSTRLGGWIKDEGELRCGWGATYGDTGPDSPGGIPYTVTIEDFSGSEYDCCLEAMSYETSDLAEGGAAIRWQVLDGSCHIDREMMMNQNLDSSGGKAAENLVLCGEVGDEYYWRQAAGGADASNLNSGGTCVLEGGFTRVEAVEMGLVGLAPQGSIPYYGHELPNHPCPDSSDEGNPNCAYSARYNNIFDAEECCRACQNLEFIGHTDIGGDASTTSDGMYVNPCLAWQVKDGMCHVLRKQIFEDRWPEYTVTETVELCASEHSDCQRVDDSHGDWGSCQEPGQPSELCNYYSHLHYREQEYRNVVDVDAAYRKLDYLDVNAINETLYLASNVSAATRARRNQLLTTEDPDSIAVALTTDCARLALYAPADVVNSDFEELVFDTVNGNPEPICVSECISYGEAYAIFSYQGY